MISRGLQCSPMISVDLPIYEMHLPHPWPSLTAGLSSPSTDPIRRGACTGRPHVPQPPSSSRRGCGRAARTGRPHPPPRLRRRPEHQTLFAAPCRVPASSALPAARIARRQHPRRPLGAAIDARARSGGGHEHPRRGAAHARIRPRGPPRRRVRRRDVRPVWLRAGGAHVESPLRDGQTSAHAPGASSPINLPSPSPIHLPSPSPFHLPSISHHLPTHLPTHLPSP